MPEGPEVLFMIDSLQKYVNKKLLKLNITSGRYKRHKLPINYKKFSKSLPSKIKKIACKGKFIYIIFENDWCIWITLGMSGHFVFDKEKHCHYTFKTTNDEFYIDDMRNFGTLHFYKINDKMFSLEKKLDSLGYDPIQTKISFKQFKEHFRKFLKKTPKKEIAILLLDQTFIAGIGNYLRSEILYEAKLSPKMKLKQFSDLKLKKLYKYCIKIPKNSYEHQKRYLMLHSYPFKIYKKDKTPKGEKVKKYKMNGRSVYSIY